MTAAKFVVIVVVTVSLKSRRRVIRHMCSFYCPCHDNLCCITVKFSQLNFYGNNDSRKYTGVIVGSNCNFVVDERWEQLYRIYRSPLVGVTVESNYNFVVDVRWEVGVTLQIHKRSGSYIEFPMDLQIFDGT
jgi:hypothetical protein